MARFNKGLERRGPKTVADTPTTNLAGGAAYAQDPKMEFVSILLTSMLKDQYYRSADETAQRLAGLIEQLDPLFAAKASIYARNEFGMRSITHLTAAELAHRVKGEEWMKDYINAVVFRVDDMTEIMAAYMSKFGKPVPNSLKKGLALAFQKFDGYQLAKYRAEGKALSLVDLVRIVHPTPSIKNAEALQRLIKGELRSVDTWEAKVSAAGKSDNKKEAKAIAWSEMVLSGKIGYLALLRNLRNLEQIRTESPAHVHDAVIEKAAAILTNEHLVGKSKIFPFQYLQAWYYVSDSRIKDALETAVQMSVQNVPSLPGRSLIAVDHSGSMGNGIGSNNFIANMFGAMLRLRTDADLMTFGDYAEYVHPESVTVLAMADEWGLHNTGHGTNMGAVFQTANKAYDRVFIFTDCQSWIDNDGGYYRGYYGQVTQPERTLADYSSKYNVEPFVYAFDLSGYGSSQFKSDGKHFQVPGLSEKVFDFIGVVETDKDAMIKKIEAIRF